MHKSTKKGHEMRLSENLKGIRVQRGLTQDELAELCGLSKAQISRMESGTQRNPSIETVVAISTALRVGIEELVFGPEDDEQIVFGMQLKNMLKILNELPEKNQETLKEVIFAYIAQKKAEIEWNKLNNKNDEEYYAIEDIENENGKLPNFITKNKK